MPNAYFNATGVWFCHYCGHCNRLNKRWNHWQLRCSNPTCRIGYSVGLVFWRNTVGSRKRDSFPPDALNPARRRRRAGPVNLLVEGEPPLEATVKGLSHILREREVGEG